MKARYVRVSTANQNYERQLIKENPKERLFLDVCSGSITFDEREQGKQLLKAIKSLEIDTISVHAIDRLGRNLLDILQTLQIFQTHNITVRVDNLGIDSMVKNKPNPAFKLIISVLANISEMERETMLERQREGIAVARTKGVYKGRVRGSKESNKVFLSKYPEVAKHLRKGQSLRNTAKLAEVSLGTVQKVKSIISIS